MPDLKPAAELAAANPAHIPGESPEYRAARNALLAEEIELRRHIERVAEQRRALPPGAAITGAYEFVSEDGRTSTLSDLFGDKDTLVLYSFMFGPKMPRPCPMCTNIVGAFDGNARDIAQQVSFAVVSRSSIDKLKNFKDEREWKNIRFLSDANDRYSRDFRGVSAEGDDIPCLNVFTRRDGTVRHFWTSEMYGSSADPGQDPRSAPEMASLWNVLDITPAGRPPKWYPSLEYK